MKKFFHSLVLFTAVLMLVGCSGTAPKVPDANGSTPAQPVASNSTTQQPTPSASPHCHDVHQEEMGRGEISDESIYNLDTTWQNQSKSEVKLQDNQGKTVLIAMVYASCKAACPRIISDLKAIESGAKGKYSGKLRYTLVTIDPEVDTPEKLSQLATDSHLGSDWELLRGDPDQVLELAALLGVKYKKTSETDYAHSNIISVLNGNGEIIHQQVGLGIEPAETLAVLQKELGN